jgi:hypothetical protein
MSLTRLPIIGVLGRARRVSSEGVIESSEIAATDGDFEISRDSVKGASEASGVLYVINSGVSSYIIVMPI